MNKSIFLFLALLIFGGQSIACSQEDGAYQKSPHLVSSQKTFPWFNRLAKALLWSTIIGLDTIVARNSVINHNNFDSQRPFTCADVHQELRDTCGYLQYSGADIWARTGEVESVPVTETSTSEEHVTVFMRMCRYTP